MRLQTKINVRFLFFTLIIFAITGVILYFVLGKVLDQNINEIIESRKNNIIQYLNHHSTPTPFESPDQSFHISQVASDNNCQYSSDTIIYDKEENELDHYRITTFTTSAHGKNYEVVINHSLLEAEDFKKTILIFMSTLFLILLSSLFLLNRWLSLSVWKPFYMTLNKLKFFRIEENKDLSFSQTDVNEFSQLNQALKDMIHKAQMGYENLKEFTENASHELQTPLAIIKSKVELFLQDKTLNDKQHQQIRIIHETTNRLSKLTETLLLLSKIENRQFVEQTEINLSALILHKVEYLEELFAFKKIKVSTQLSSEIKVTMNPILADILINNLLNNALKHNIENGEIIIFSINRVITIQNTGEAPTIDSQKIFQRFAKQSDSSESTGLGLAIANEICKNYGFTLKYKFKNDLHTLVLTV